MTEAGLASVYIETNVFIYAVEGTKETSEGPKRLIEFLRKRPGMAVTSEITFAEVLAPPSRADALPLHIKRRLYLDLLLWSGFVNLVPVSRGVLIETADLRTVTKLRLPDAIHLVSAIQCRCRYLVSHDDDFKVLPEGMKHVRADAQEIDNMLKVIG